MTTQTREALNPFQLAAEAFQSSMETGLKFQKDAVEMFMGAFERPAGFEDFRNRFVSFANDSIDTIRNNAEQSNRLLEQSCRTGVDFFQKTFDRFGKSEGNGKDFFTQAQGVMQDALEVMRSTSEAFTQTNTRMLENLTQLVNKTMAVPAKKVSVSK